jgi:hypothetical protein
VKKYIRFFIPLALSARSRPGGHPLTLARLSCYTIYIVYLVCIVVNKNICGNAWGAIFARLEVLVIQFMTQMPTYDKWHAKPAEMRAIGLFQVLSIFRHLVRKPNLAKNEPKGPVDCVPAKGSAWV